MNGAQIHLAINHFPVILTYTALVILVIGMWRRNDSVIKTAYWLFLAAGLTGIVAYFSGDDAAGIIKNIPGIERSDIGEHAGSAKFALISIALTSLLALLGLLFYNRAAKIFRILVFIFALITTAVLARTAHLGGEIRHPEMEDHARNHLFLVRYKFCTVMKHYDHHDNSCSIKCGCIQSDRRSEQS
jgi:uncharacterized membrane protein